ncbi:MAG: hypothetical protein V1827_01575 [Candidatus Micrarchaeota archaeon]
MRYALVTLLFAVVFIAGCTTTPASDIVKPPVLPGEEGCTTVIEQVPYTELECGDVSYTEEVCVIRKLDYTAKQSPKVDLCISDEGCNGMALGDCQGCTQAMTRCVMEIKNEETIKSGTWSVGAEYSLGNFGFIKDPITHTIDPGETVAFDFNQIYSPGKPISSASCVLEIESDPMIEDCHQETRSREDCANVTKTRQVEREVCE